MGGDDVVLTMIFSSGVRARARLFVEVADCHFLGGSLIRTAHVIDRVIVIICEPAGHGIQAAIRVHLMNDTTQRDEYRSGGLNRIIEGSCQTLDVLLAAA
ncbi:hypothetical protein D3C81_2050800 [compost metagenome]